MKFHKLPENTEASSSSESGVEAPLLWFESFVRLLSENFEQLKSKNKYYSVRRYAQALEISVGALSEVMRGKRRLSRERAKQILEKLKAPPEHKTRILILMGENVNLSESYGILNKQIEINWDPEREMVATHFALSGIEVTPHLIAQRLGMSVEHVERVISDCLDSGLLVRDGMGTIVQKERENSFLTQLCISNDKNFKEKYKANLELAQKALEMSTSESGDFMSFTFAGSDDSIAFFKKELRQILYKMSLLAQVSPGSQVIQISSQMFSVDMRGPTKR